MITLLIPAYNEEAVIEQCIRRIIGSLQLAEEYEILVVNDGSQDATRKIVEHLHREFPQLRIVSHAKNQGLGAALQTGFVEAKGRIIITMDADLTHPPSLVNDLVREIEPVDVCIASRYVKGGGMLNVPTWRVALSKMANIFFQTIFLTRVRDITAGFRAYKKNIVSNVTLPYKGFEIQLALSAMLLKKSAVIKEIPYTLTNREVGSSKFNVAKMIPKYARNIVKIWYYRWFL